MPSFALVVTPDGATLQVGVSPRIYAQAPNLPQTRKALIDTGATLTVISPAVRLALNPPSLGLVPIGRAGGVQSWEPTYDFRIRLGGHIVAHNRWFNLEVVEIQPATPLIDVIIGTDLLIKLELSWRGPARSGSLQY